MEYTLYQKLSKIALHEQKAGLVLKNAMVVDVFTDEIRQADIAVSDGYIAAVGSSYEGEREVDLNGKYVLPGFMDSHLHLESTMVTPNELVSAAALCGTTTFIVDPHEAANVSVPDGICLVYTSSFLDIHNIGCVDVAFLMNDSAILVRSTRLRVFCQHINAFNQNLTVFFVHGNNFAFFVFIFSSDDLYSVASFNLHS